MDRLSFILVALLFFLVAVAFSSGVAATNSTSSTQKDTPKVPDPWNTRTGTSYTTIQAAINDAQPGDTIIAETGTYTENIQINKKITLKAQGTPTIKAKNTNQHTIKITSTGSGTTITGFIIINGDCGIYLENANNCNITKNNIKNNTWDGIYLDHSSNNTISGNNINNNTYNGIELEYSSNNRIYNNNITNNGDGIELEYSSNNRIYNNNITNNGDGIILWYDSLNNIISGNNIKNNINNGISFVDTSSNNRIYNNTITNNQWSGISFVDTSSNNRIYNNTITNNRWHGIFFFEYSSNNRIYNNSIKNNTDDGIRLYNSLNNVLSNNSINNNYWSGIRLDNSLNNVLSNNSINNNHWGGIRLYNSLNNVLSNNSINNNIAHGIRLYNSSNNTITGNNIKNNDTGIYLQDSSNKNTISRNNITNNKHGIYLLESDNNKVYRNNFIGNGVQAKVESGSANLFNLAKPTGGNFWSDYTGKDSNGDGFGDTPYTFTGGKDNLPLIQPLKILSIDPTNGTVSVPLNKTIVVTFNWNIQAGPDYNKITVKMPDGTAKTITKWISGNKLYIKAKYGWNPGVKFTVTIPKNAIKNNLGKMLASDFKSIFVAVIKVNSIDPVNGAVNVPKTKTIIVTFNANIFDGPGYNKITVKTSTGIAWIITKWITGNKLYIKATYGWNPGTKFTVTIPRNAIKNSLGSMLATDFKSSFTTAS